MATATEQPTAPADPDHTPPAGDPQEGMFDKVVNDDTLEALLDKREDLKAKKSAATKAFKEKDDAVKARIAEFDLADGEVARVGKYRVEKKATQGRSVSFETDPSSRLTIKLFD